MAEVKLDTAKIGVAVVVVVGAFLAFQAWGRVTALESRVLELNVAVQQLEDVDDRITDVGLQVAQTEADLQRVAAAREDILRTLCDILGRPVERCGVSS